MGRSSLGWLCFFIAVVQRGSAPARSALETIFGSAVLRYADRAWSTDNQDLRVACCDLAVQDPKVVLTHAGNIVVVGGRHGTVCASAFMGKLAIVPERIIAVETADCSTYSAPNIDVSLSDLVPL